MSFCAALGKTPYAFRAATFVVSSVTELERVDKLDGMRALKSSILRVQVRWRKEGHNVSVELLVHNSVQYVHIVVHIHGFTEGGRLLMISTSQRMFTLPPVGGKEGEKWGVGERARAGTHAVLCQQGTPSEKEVERT